ncbi:MAG: PAS domain-containing protein, partial [Chloroflexota bacterium]
MTVQRKSGPLTFLTGVLQRQEDTGFRHLAEQLSDAVFLVVPRTGLFRYFNHRAADMTGYSREELDRQSLSELLSSPGAAEALDLIHKLEIGVQRIVPNVPLKIKSGKLVYTDLRVSATLSEGEVLALIIARDTEQRMMLEQAWNDHQHSLAALGELTTLLASPTQESSQP